MDRKSTQAMARADKWLAGTALEQGKLDIADDVQDRADEAVKSLTSK